MISHQISRRGFLASAAGTAVAVVCPGLKSPPADVRSITIDGSSDYLVRVTLTADSAVRFVNLTPGKTVVLLVQQDAVGGRTLTWPASCRWPDGYLPALTPEPDAGDFVMLMSDGERQLATHICGARTAGTRV